MANGLAHILDGERNMSMTERTVSVALGLGVWWFLRQAATRGVRIWVLAKGRVHKGRLLRAILLGLLPSRRAR